MNIEIDELEKSVLLLLLRNERRRIEVLLIDRNERIFWNQLSVVNGLIDSIENGEQ